MIVKLILFGALAFVILLVACGSSTTATQSVAATGSAAKVATPTPSNGTGTDRLGGLYLPVLEQMASKIPVFEDLMDFPPLSKSQLLSKEVLKQSISSHRVNSQYGGKYQRYNYVLRELESPGAYEIIIAVWNTQEDLNIPVKDKLKVTSLSKNCQTLIANHFESLKEHDDDALKESDDVATMINFYPEDPLGNDKADFCQNRKILDELTKHFMLAQGPGTTYPKFKLSWRESKIAYAGEIIIDVEICQYTITNGSGTYIPDPNKLYLVAEEFGIIFDSNYPAYQVDNGPDKKGPRRSLENNGILPLTVCDPST